MRVINFSEGNREIGISSEYLRPSPEGNVNQIVARENSGRSKV